MTEPPTTVAPALDDPAFYAGDPDAALAALRAALVAGFAHRHVAAVLAAAGGFALGVLLLGWLAAVGFARARR